VYSKQVLKKRIELESDNELLEFVKLRTDSSLRKPWHTPIKNLIVHFILQIATFKTQGRVRERP